ncbi:MAG: hypothetical protein P8Q14_04315 [Vicingaceae bacterium]|nr:hypothetical protein [Vicingaceae bacterium]
MGTGSIFGIFMGVGAVIGLCFGQEYMLRGIWVGIAVAAVVVMTKNKKNEKE